MANEDALIKMFGFELRRAGAKVSTDKDNLKSIVPPQDQDGSGYVTAAGAHYGQYIDRSVRLQLLHILIHLDPVEEQ